MDPHEIARKLTKAQRRALLDMVGGDGIFLTRWKYGRSVPALHRLGLTLAPPAPPPGLIAAATPLGLAVRRILEERRND